MSNFSNIGFNAKTQEDFQQLLDKSFRVSRQVKINEGTYSIYTDSSGAELYLQLNNKNTCIGVNPHFKGKSKRTVCLINIVDRKESKLDGAFHCWAAPTEVNNPDSGEYPFIFDSPDFKIIGDISFPQNFEIQLVAFAQELNIFESEGKYYDSQISEPKFAIQSFIPSGLFSAGEDNSNPPQALGIFTGIIKEFERKKNNLTNEEFYWLLVDTLGGEVDVVADINFFEKDPQINGVVQGQFWFSGQLINPPFRGFSKPKSFLQKLFGR